MRALAVTIATVAMAASVGLGQAGAQESTSTPLAQKLVQALQARQIDVVAVRDPNEPDRFYAVLHIPGIQLLFVSARYPVPMYVDKRIAEHDYREAYADLNAACLPEGKVFIEDVFADGLKPVPPERGPGDFAYEEVHRRTKFDGNWKAQNLSEGEYLAKFKALDAHYARALTLLLAQLREET